MAIKSTLILSILLILFVSVLTTSFAAETVEKSKSSEVEADDDDEDLRFLEEDEAVSPSSSSSSSDAHYESNNDHEDSDSDAADSSSDDGGHEAYSPQAVDETDVVVLRESNFSDFIANNKYVMVEFYAPWCGHCKALAPEYAAAATELKKEEEDEKVVLAKVDAMEERELAQKYDVQGFPTVYFFVDGAHKPYTGQRTKGDIVTWVKKKIGPGLNNITTVEDAENILAAESKLVLAFLDALVGSTSEELAAASKLEDDVNFYQTTSPDVAKLYQIDPQVKRPALVIIKKEAEKINHFDGQFTKSAINEFVYKNKLPLVINFTRDNAPLIFENPIRKLLLLFATSNDSEKVLPIFEEAAKDFKGKLLCIYVALDGEDVGKQVSRYFGVQGDAPRVITYTGNEDARKFLLDGDLTLSNIKLFVEKFLEGNLTPFYKSDPIPEKNDEDVKIVVGNNFDEIVLDESKDVLLEIYAPWCGHCQTLEPIYNKLGKHLRGVDSLVIAKMDGTANEHRRAKVQGFPTLLFFPAGNKSLDPVIVDTDRTVVAFYKFLKKHATIPFKLQKPASSPQPKGAEATVSDDSSSKDVKDEL